jgi:DNA-binding MarR family transcriptional regulator
MNERSINSKSWSSFAAPFPVPDDRIQTKVEQMLRERSQRGDWFGSAYLGDIPWTILLLLYAAYEQRRCETVTSIFKAVNGPQSTVVRWIHSLALADLVSLTTGGSDRRMTEVRMSTDACHRMSGYLAEIGADFDRG